MVWPTFCVKSATEFALFTSQVPIVPPTPLVPSRNAQQEKPNHGKVGPTRLLNDPTEYLPKFTPFFDSPQLVREIITTLPTAFHSF
jgi:hypothetical protein